MSLQRKKSTNVTEKIKKNYKDTIHCFKQTELTRQKELNHILFLLL